MLQSVDVGPQRVAIYEESAGKDAVALLRALAEPLRGVRVLHVNATPYGGGVAEILRSEIALLRDLGIAADWKLITGDDAFFSVTKAIHNGLQGAARALTPAEQEVYLANSLRNAQLLEEEYDLIQIHDPQPLALLPLHGKGSARWIWRCHIDTAEPNRDVLDFLLPYLADYDAAVFTLGNFVPPRFPVKRIEIIPPAIDPESPKNLELPAELARRVVQWTGIDVDRPLITQVSRFDPWKDPLGVIDTYRLVKREVPDLQLALVGSMALDDPEGWTMYREIREAAGEDPNVHLFTNLNGVGNIEVNAFQRLSDVVIQKSLREGFGLVVSEALWKWTPVVAGRAGGIPLQLSDGEGGFLVDSVEDCAERILWLLRHPGERRALVWKGHARVRERFLLTRLIADELRLWADVLGKSIFERHATTTVGPAPELRDPVCGMRLDPATAIASQDGAAQHHFCSHACRAMFEEATEQFRGAVMEG